MTSEAKKMEIFRDGEWKEIDMREMKEGDRVRDPDLDLPIEFIVRKNERVDGIPELDLEVSIPDDKKM